MTGPRRFSAQPLILPLTLAALLALPGCYARRSIPTESEARPEAQVREENARAKARETQELEAQAKADEARAKAEEAKARAEEAKAKVLAGLASPDASGKFYENAAAYTINVLNGPEVAPEEAAAPAGPRASRRGRTR